MKILDNVTDENKKSLLSKLKLSLDDYAVELVLKDNVKTFVIVKNIVKKEKTVVEKTVKKESFLDKKILNEIEETKDQFQNYLLESNDFYKKLDIVFDELYDDDRNIFESLKVFFERLDDELCFEVDNHLHMQQIHLIKELRRQFETLKSKSESSNQ